MTAHLPLLLLVSTLSAAATPPKTFRVDYFHSGNATEEHFSLDRLVVEPLPFPGNPAHAVDDSNLGKFFFEVRDQTTHQLLYSRGFSSIFGEWETTTEAKGAFRTFEESLRFPLPERPVRIALQRRDAANRFREVGAFAVDPHDVSVDPSLPPSPGPLVELMKNGPSPEKVDLLILGDGYTVAERPKFLQDARRLVDILFGVSPFKEHRQDFNVWGLCPPAEASGISRPSTGVHRRSRVGATYDAFGSERYILTFENRSFRDVASFAPYEFVEILTNSKTYGGGGIYNLFSTVAADNLWAPYVFVHEFGHHFGGLADEYFTSESVYAPASARPEPWEPNVTASPEREKLKWKDLVQPGTPLPTPWKKAAYERRSEEIQKLRRQIRATQQPEAEMDALFLQQKAEDTQLLSTDQYSGRTGAFEGAQYESHGYYRPAEDCVMFSRDAAPFCSVCQAAIRRVIDLYTTGARTK